MDAPYKQYQITEIKSATHGTRLAAKNFAMFKEAVNEWKSLLEQDSEKLQKLNLTGKAATTQKDLEKFVRLYDELMNAVELKFIRKKTAGFNISELQRQYSEANELCTPLFGNLSIVANAISASLPEGKQWDDHQRVKHDLTNGLKALTELHTVLKHAQQETSLGGRK